METGLKLQKNFFDTINIYKSVGNEHSDIRI